MDWINISILSIAGLIGAISLVTLIWAIIGQWPGKTPRCRRCWYDMSGASGLKCPECGTVAKSARSLVRSRRRWRWVWRSIALLLCAAVLAAVPIYRSGKWLAWSPTSVLVQAVVWNAAPGKEDQAAILRELWNRELTRAQYTRLWNNFAETIDTASQNQTELNGWSLVLSSTALTSDGEHAIGQGAARGSKSAMFEWVDEDQFRKMADALLDSLHRNQDLSTAGMLFYMAGSRARRDQFAADWSRERLLSEAALWPIFKLFVTTREQPRFDELSDALASDDSIRRGRAALIFLERVDFQGTATQANVAAYVAACRVVPEDPDLFMKQLRSLAKPAIDDLIAKLETGDSPTRRCAAMSIKSLGIDAAPALPALKAAMNSDDATLADLAAYSSAWIEYHLDPNPKKRLPAVPAKRPPTPPAPPSAPGS